MTEKVVGEVYGNNLLRRLKTDENIFRDQRVKASANGAANLRFLDKSRLTVGPKTEIVLDKFVYDPESNANKGTVRLVRGVLRFTSAALDRDVKFETPSVTIGIRGTTIDIMVTGRSTEVVVHEGRVEVSGPRGSVFVNAGETLTVNGTDSARSTQGSPDIQRSVSNMLALVGDAPSTGGSTRTAQQEGQKKPAISTLNQPGAEPSPAPAQTPTPTQEIASIQGKNPEYLLYLDLPYGQVIIEMRQDLAPRHVARIKHLVRDGFYNGLKFHSVIPARFAMTGDPTGTGRGGSGTLLDAELSSEVFRRGSVGMAHDRGKPNSADSQFFISLEPFPEIDGKYTLWGRVIHGMHFLDQLRTGNPPAEPDIIVRARIGADFAG